MLTKALPEHQIRRLAVIEGQSRSRINLTHHPGHRELVQRNHRPGLLELLRQPCGRRPAACGADPSTAEPIRSQMADGRAHPNRFRADTAHLCQPGRCRGHPQHPAPEATASCLAWLPQHESSAFASAAVPQHVDDAVSAPGVVAGPPQQPPADAGGFNAASGSPWNPPVDSVFSVPISVLISS